MLERGWEVTACDISPSMVELARKIEKMEQPLIPAVSIQKHG